MINRKDDEMVFVIICHGNEIAVPSVGIGGPCPVCGSIFEFESPEAAALILDNDLFWATGSHT